MKWSLCIKNRSQKALLHEAGKTFDNPYQSKSATISTMNLSQKTTLLTGGSSGIGYELSKQLIAKGAHVINFDVSEAEDPVDGVQTIDVDVTNVAGLSFPASTVRGRCLE